MLVLGSQRLTVDWCQSRVGPPGTSWSEPLRRDGSIATVAEVALRSNPYSYTSPLHRGEKFCHFCPSASTLGLIPLACVDLGRGRQRAGSLVPNRDPRAWGE